MSEEVTIKIKKENLWKYATFLLAAVLIIGAFVTYTGSNKQPSANTGTQQQQAAAQQASGQQAAITVDASKFSDTTLYPTLGPSNAKDTVIEFADFQCPYCALATGLPSWTSQSQYSQYSDLIGAAGKIEDMAKQGQVRFIYVSMSFLGQESVYAAQAGICANQQGKFWELHDAIFNASTGPQEDTGKYSVPNLEIIASKISGLDQNKFKNCLESNSTLADVQSIGQTASSAGVSGTPFFVVNGQQVASSWSALQASL